MKRVILFAAALAVASSGFAHSATRGGDAAPAMSSIKAASSAKEEASSTARPTRAKATTKTGRVARAAARPAPIAMIKKQGRVSMKIGPRKSKLKAIKSETNVDTMETASINTSGDARAYSAIVSRYAATYGVPTSLAHAVISVESNYRVDARGSAGEIGLMQIKPDTARMMGYNGSSKGLFDPETNIKYGVKYLAMAQKLGGGDTCGTILRYNAGHGATRMNPISAAYCSKVKRVMAG